MPHGGRGYLLHSEQYEGPDTPFRAGTHEAATLTCRHCNVVVVLNPQRRRDRGVCYRCNSYLCDACYGIRDRQGCYPVEEAVALARRFAPRGKVVLLSRGPHGEVLGDEIALAAQTRPYGGITLPGKD